MIDVSGCVETLTFYFKTRLVSDRALLGFSRVRKLWMKTRNQRVLPGITSLRSKAKAPLLSSWSVSKVSLAN